VDANTKAPRIELAAEFQADELVGSVILSLAQELVAVANSCALNEVPFEVTEYEKDWRKCLQADRLEAAKATQRLQESNKATKDMLVSWMDEPIRQRVAATLGRRGELSLVQSILNKPLRDVYAVLLAVVSPDPSAEWTWLKSFGEHLAFYDIRPDTDIVARTCQLQAIAARVNDLAPDGDDFEERTARLVCRSLGCCTQGSVEHHASLDILARTQVRPGIPTEALTLSLVLNAIQARRRMRLDEDRQSLVTLVAGLAVAEKDRLAAAESAPPRPSVTAFSSNPKKKYGKYRVF
jgi:hypothetical protein